MTIGAISAAVASLPSLPSVPSASTGTTAAGAPGFGDQVTRALDELSTKHNQVDQLAQQAAVGTLEDVHDYTIAAAEASVMTELTVAVRNKAVEAFNDIMRMQL